MTTFCRGSLFQDRSSLPPEPSFSCSTRRPFLPQTPRTLRTFRTSRSWATCSLPPLPGDGEGAHAHAKLTRRPHPTPRAHRRSETAFMAWFFLIGLHARSLPMCTMVGSAWTVAATVRRIMHGHAHAPCARFLLRTGMGVTLSHCHNDGAANSQAPPH